MLRKCYARSRRPKGGSSDTGGLVRNRHNVEIVSQRLEQCPHPFTSGVDLGGGYGLFVRGMRDAGWNFYWTDRYATNLLARGFEATAGVHEVVTAFEVLEHIENPLKFLQDARQAYQFETCFFSATCFDELKRPGDDWWYWSTETGQHISFFSLKSLNWMAGQLNMSLHHIEGEIYCFSRHDWARSFHMWQAQHAKKMGKALESLLRVGLKTKPKPLTWSDYLTTRAALRTPGRAGQEP